jgi:hypothetical protein
MSLRINLEAEITFVQSVKELFFLIMLVVVLGCMSWLVIYANLAIRFWKHRDQIPRYLTRCAILATKLSIGAVIIGSIMGMLIFAGGLIIYTLTYMTLGLLSPGLFIAHPSAIIRTVLIISVILGSLLETRSMNKKISLYDLRIFSLQKCISY